MKLNNGYSTVETATTAGHTKRLNNTNSTGIKQYTQYVKDGVQHVVTRLDIYMRALSRFMPRDSKSGLAR